MRASPCSSVVERFRVLLGNSASMSTHTGHWSSHLYGIDLRHEYPFDLTHTNRPGNSGTGGALPGGPNGERHPVLPCRHSLSGLL